MASTECMLEALDSPNAFDTGTTSPGVPRPGPSWAARLRGLVTALEARVPGAASPPQGVAAQSRLVARRLGIQARKVRRIACAARVHDVGKIIVSPELLQKPGRLTPMEF